MPRAALAAAAAAFAWLIAGRRRRCAGAIGIIPARHASTRFPGKPLCDLLGKPMIQRVYERAVQARSLARVVVATDDERIAATCRKFGAEVVMTSVFCANGTERCAEAARKIGGGYDILCMLQGDEPLMEPEVIDAAVGALRRAKRRGESRVVYTTPATALAPSDAPLRQRVKVVTDLDGDALYFSRAMIPHNKEGAPRANVHYLLHLGLQVYDMAFVHLYCTLPDTPLMQSEDLEQLKVLEHGYRIRVVRVEHRAFGVDVPEDADAIREMMREMGYAGAPVEAAE